MTSDSDSVEWDGTTQVAKATVSGTSLELEFTYNGSTTAPSDAGSYQVIASIDDDNVQGSASAMLTITPREAGNTNIQIEIGRASCRERENRVENADQTRQQ